MVSVDSTLTNTILIPNHDGLVEGHPLPAYDIAGKIGEAADPDSYPDKNFAAFLKINDKESIRMIGVQEITGLGMERTNEQKSVATGDYVINLPGPVKYSNIKIKHIFTRDKFFLDWLTNGISKGGSARADIEIKLSTSGKKRLVFTLYDAFPVGWSLTNLDAGNSEVAVMEEVELTFSGIYFKSEQSAGD